MDNGSYQASYTFTTLSGNTTYTVHVKDASACVYSQSVTIKPYSSPITLTIDSSGPKTFCAGGSVTLTATGASTYTWNTGATTPSITVTAGNTTYSVEATSADGCKGPSDTIRVTVNSIPSAPIVSDTVKYCQGYATPSVLTATIQTGAIANWYQSGNPLTGAPTPSTANVGYTTYSVSQTVKGCSGPQTPIVVDVLQAPTTNPLVTSPVLYCFQSPAKALTATVTATGATLSWQNPSHQSIPSNPTPSTTTLAPITYYVYQSIGACSGPIDSIQVVVSTKPSPNFSTKPLTNISAGQSVSFIPSQQTPGISYYWSFEDMAPGVKDTSHVEFPFYTYNLPGSYCPKLLVIDQSTGCKDSTTLCLDILSNITISIPNIFSPNGDGINDAFSVKSTGITTLSCDIFDRWGLKLYSWNGINGYWDGTEKTGKAVDGTYFYVIQTTDVKGEDHKYNGFIQLIK